VTKRAHITSRPEYQVGDQVLGLCGKEFEVKVLWHDLPDSKPICRECVDFALEALTECENVISIARSRIEMAMLRMAMVSNVLNPEDDMILDLIRNMDQEHQEKLSEAQGELEAAEKAKATCTCEWTSPEMFTVDPDCPIHGPAKAEELLDAIQEDHAPAPLAEEQ
jgi:hypothetical protein